MDDKEMLEMFQLIFDKTNAGMTLYNDEGRLIEINRSAIEFYGITDKNRLLSKNFNICDDPNYFQFFANKQFPLNDDFNIDFCYNFDSVRRKSSWFTKLSGTRWVSLNIRHIKDINGGIKYILATTTDIADIKRRQFLMDKMNNDLFVLMKSGSLSNWIFNIETKRRVLIQGGNLFPELSYMEDFIGMIHRHDVSKFRKILSDIICGDASEGKMVIRIKNSQSTPKYIYLDTSCYAQKEKGRLSDIAFITKNITEQATYQRKLEINKIKMSALIKEVERSNQLLRTVIDGMPCLFFIKDVDNDFRYVMANEMTCDVMGKTKEEVIGHTDFEVLDSKEEAARFRSDDEDVIANGRKDYKEVTSWYGVRRVLHTVKSVIVTNAGSRFIVAMSVDISDLQLALAEMEKAKTKAEQADKLKSTFLANTSHEIRTPLNSIVGFSNIIVDTDDAGEREEYGKIINTNANLLLNLINEVLDLSKVEAGRVHMKQEPFDLHTLYNEFANTFNKRMKENVTLSCTNPYKKCIITLDKNRFCQVVNNFMTNAIKYTPSGRIELGYEYIKGSIHFYVTDTGIGISNENKSKVFGRFEKFDNFAQGTGLGLSICKAIVESAGGKIGFESQLGKGSTFWATVPCCAQIEKQ